MSLRGLQTVEGQVGATRRAAEVIAALPTSSWPAHLTHVVARTGIAPGIALSEAFDAAQLRTGAARGPQEERTAEASVALDGAAWPDAARASAPEMSAETFADTLRPPPRAAASARRPAPARPWQRR
jgi:hypothetical protein